MKGNTGSLHKDIDVSNPSCHVRLHSASEAELNNSYSAVDCVVTTVRIAPKRRLYVLIGCLRIVAIVATREPMRRFQCLLGTVTPPCGTEQKRLASEL